MDSQSPEVSVLIPAYNAEKFIECTINSSLNQTFSNLEVIVVDDGSKDRTAEIVHTMQKQDSRIKYFYQDNQGLSNTRNRLVELARGKFIAFLDHDDEWLPQKIGRQLKLFENNEKVGLVFSDAYIKKDGKIIGTCFQEINPFRGDIFFKYLFCDNFVPLLTVVLPKEVLVEFMPFNPEYKISEEFDMFLRIAHDYKFDYIDEPLAVYNLHGNNQILFNRQRLIEEDFAILDSWLKKDPSIDKLYRKELGCRLSHLYYRKGLYFLEKKDISGVIDTIFNSFKHRLLNFEAFKLSIKLILKILRIR